MKQKHFQNRRFLMNSVLLSKYHIYANFTTCHIRWPSKFFGIKWPIICLRIYQWKFFSRSNSFPLVRWNRSSPSEISNRWFSIWYSFEYSNSWIKNITLNNSIVGAYCFHFFWLEKIWSKKSFWFNVYFLIQISIALKDWKLENNVNSILYHWPLIYFLNIFLFNRLYSLEIF